MLTSKDQSRLMTLTHHFEPGGQDEEGLRRRNACPGARAGCPGRSSCADHDALGSNTRDPGKLRDLCIRDPGTQLRNHPHVDVLRRHCEDDPLELRDRVDEPRLGRSRAIASRRACDRRARRHTDHQRQQRAASSRRARDSSMRISAGRSRPSREWSSRPDSTRKRCFRTFARRSARRPAQDVEGAGSHLSRPPPDQLFAKYSLIRARRRSCARSCRSCGSSSPATVSSTSGASNRHFVAAITASQVPRSRDGSS